MRPAIAAGSPERTQPGTTRGTGDSRSCLDRRPRVVPPIGAAGLLDARRVVLREWVDAAGGWSDAAAVHLPDGLPNGLALATLKAHARALGLAGCTT